MIITQEEARARLQSLEAGVRAGLRHFQETVVQSIADIEHALPDIIVRSEPWRWECSECGSGMLKKGSEDFYVHACTKSGVTE